MRKCELYLLQASPLKCQFAKWSQILGQERIYSGGKADVLSVFVTIIWQKNCTSASQCLNCSKRYHVSICEAYLSHVIVGAGNTVQSNSHVLAPEASSFKPQAKNQTSTDSCQTQVTPVVTAFVDSSTCISSTPNSNGISVSS